MRKDRRSYKLVIPHAGGTNKQPTYHYPYAGGTTRRLSTSLSTLVVQTGNL